MPTVIIDRREIRIPEGRRLNGIEAARLAGIEIPHYCWHPGLSVAGTCRMCLVEVGTRDPATGKITMQPKLQPACNTLVTDNMILVTDSEKVAQARAMVEEDLLLRHPVDCPICDKAGECLLQDYHYRFGRPERRADIFPFSSRRKDLGDVILFADRCILCTRCVRFAAEISGGKELMLIGRGTEEEIGIVDGYPLCNKLSGNVVDLCPVGALVDKDFLYKQRVWFLRRHANVCTGCAVGCSIWIEEHQERIYRIKPRENPFLNKWWICNDGRYDYSHVHDPRRLLRAEKSGAPLLTVDLQSLAEEINRSLRAAGRLAAVVSPHLTVEEAYLLCKLIRGIDSDALLALGPVPVIGEDESFPGGFLIAAEKCPNRRGVEAVIAYFAHRAASFDELLTEVDQGLLGGVWVSAGYKHEWIGPATASRFDRLKLLVVQDLFPSPLLERATYVLPAPVYAERDGSYVNRYDRMQAVHRAIRPPKNVRTEGELFWAMLGGEGRYDASRVREQLAYEIPYFAAARGGVPESGVDLKSNLLADEGDVSSRGGC